MASFKQHSTDHNNGSQVSATSRAASEPERDTDQPTRRVSSLPRTSASQQPPADRTVQESSQNQTEQTPSAAIAFDTSGTCIECGAQSFRRSGSGEWYCDACGVVHTEARIKFSEPGWQPRDQRRTGPATSVSRVSIGTIVGRPHSESTPSWAAYNNRLTHEQRTLREGLRELRAVATALEATTELTEQAAYLFRCVTSEDMLVGHSIEAMAAVCLHATARENQTPFPLKQVEAASPVDESRIKSAYSKLVRELELQIPPPSPSAFVPRFASEAGFSVEVRRRATELVETLIEDGEHIGQNPMGVAAAALYAAAKEHDEDILQEKLATIAFVSVVTLSRQWQTVKRYTNLEGV